MLFGLGGVFLSLVLFYGVIRLMTAIVKRGKVK